MFESLRARLIAVSVGITVVSLCMLALTLFFFVRSNTVQSIDERVSQMTQAYAGQVASWARDRQQITASLKAVVGSPEPVPFLLTTKAAGGFDNAFYVQADKTAVFPKPRAPDYDGTSRPWYKLAVAKGGPAITPAYTDSTTGILTISFVEPLMGSDGKVMAVVGSDVHLTGISKLVSEVKPMEKSFALLVDEEGKLLASPNPDLVLQPVSKISENLNMPLLQQLQGRREHSNVLINGEENFLYVAKVPETPWTLVVAVDRSEAIQPVVTMLKVAGLITALCVVIASVLITIVVSHQLRRLKRVRNALNDIASGDGDLTKRMESTGRDELSEISQAFNRFTDKIEAVLVRIRESSESVRMTTQEISSGNVDLSERTELQATAIQKTASAMQDLTSTVRQNADNAREAKQLASAASDVATRGGEVVGNVVQTMQEINASSQKIADIIGVIDSIAFQTNILALNAAVEAARAGDQGRGFAVVASEVRTLAQRSATAAKEIKGLIDDSVSQVDAGSRLVNDAGVTIQEVVERVRQVSTIVSEISLASEEQSSGIANVGNAIHQMDESTQQNAALVEEAAAAAQSLQQQAHSLADTVAGFKVRAFAGPGVQAVSLAQGSDRPAPHKASAGNVRLTNSQQETLSLH